MPRSVTRRATALSFLGSAVACGAPSLLFLFFAWTSLSVATTTPAGRNERGDTDQEKGAKIASAGSPTPARSKKQPLINLLLAAGVEVDAELIQELPEWEEVVKMYGSRPILYGEEQCKHIQSTFNESSPAFLAVAGFFNTGTNAMHTYLQHNCEFTAGGDSGNAPVDDDNSNSSSSSSSMIRRRGRILWQPPWGKHMLASHRFNQTIANMDYIDRNRVVPVVMVRDPYRWMKSTCCHPYQLHWTHDADRHCPNLVPREADFQLDPALRDAAASVSVSARMGARDGQDRFTAHWKSLVHVWNEWNREYFDATFPRLMVRFEDLLFRPKDLTRAVCECVGGTFQEDNFQYYAKGLKANFKGDHKSSTSMASAIIKYGKSTDRGQGMTRDDLDAVIRDVDYDLMNAFGYSTVIDG